MKYGILGGTFDPIHLGHLRTAEEMVQELGLAKLFLIPAASPPHKHRRPVSAFHHRLKMAQLAIGNSDSLQVLDVEGKRQGPSYSIDTLKELAYSLGPENDLYFVLGLDGFFEIHTWKKYQDLFGVTHFVLVNRRGYQFQDIFPYLDRLGLRYTKTQNPDQVLMESGRWLLHKRSTQMDISSTHIRELVQRGRSIRFLVPDNVMKYIYEKGLYT
ncbi:MAG: nicotinic acid mononucleotide adenylyltransferase [Deltaproteobacteria bacterium]|nr:MAG: nicotinic acid mononucleotide adenylyltransferase [Deltaproteobacteria bacterium]